MIVRGESTIIDYHAPFDQGFTVSIPDYGSWWNKTQLNMVEEFEFECSRCGKKVNLMSSIPAVKTTTRPTSAGRSFVALLFLVNGQYFKDYHKILGTLGLDHVSFTQWIHVEWIAPFVKRNAHWSVQKARNEAVRRGEKIQFRRLLSDSRPPQLRRYLPRCEDWQNLYIAYECKLP